MTDVPTHFTEGTATYKDKNSFMTRNIDELELAGAKQRAVMTNRYDYQSRKTQQLPLNENKRMNE
jgi:hypothetical protein